MKIFFLIIKVLIFLVFLLLAVSNIQTVEFNYLPGQGMQMPLVAVLFGAFVIGVLLGILGYTLGTIGGYITAEILRHIVAP